MQLKLHLYYTLQTVSTEKLVDNFNITDSCKF